MSLIDQDPEEIAELIESNSADEVEEILEIADDNCLTIEDAKEVKELADEYGLDIDEATELKDLL